MPEVLTLNELSSRVGVDVAHLQRMIRIGSLPEARKQALPEGATWVVPTDRVDELVTRCQWAVETVDLTGEEPGLALVDDVTPEAKVATDDAAVESGGIGGEGECDSEGRELVPHGDNDGLPSTYNRTDEEITVAEIIDGALLNRLLGAQEDRAEAEARARESQRAMNALATGQQRIVRELAEERYERQRSADRLRDERSARLVADAKLAELRAVVDREQSVAEIERQARLAATRRSIEAEHEAALALASMGWMARRRFERRIERLHGSDRALPDHRSS